MTDDQIETMVLDLIEVHLDEKAREVAVAWLYERARFYDAAADLGLVDRVHALPIASLWRKVEKGGEAEAT
jgi:hypothetical protein